MKRRSSRRAARRGRILPRRGVRASRVCASFSRDALVSVNGAAVAEYAYDALGNLVAVANGDESFRGLQGQTLVIRSM